MNFNNSFQTTKNNNKCIGPCYPENYLYYNPLTLDAIIANKKSCAIEPNNENNYKIVDECNKIDKNYKEFNIFENDYKIAYNDDTFLRQIYEINNLNELHDYLLNKINKLPIYSQKRLLNSIFRVYNKYNDFPIDLFINKCQIILKQIYNKNLNLNKISKIIKKNINIKNKDIFDLFIK